MNKQEITAVVLLFLLLFAWGITSRRPAPPPGGQAAADTNRVVTVENDAALVASGETDVAATTETEPSTPAQDNIGEPQEPAAPEVLAVLSNAQTHVVLTSRGGAILSAELPDYRSTVDPDSGPVRLEFADAPALTLESVPGLEPYRPFEMTVSDDASTATIRRRTAGGLHFERLVRLVNSYRIELRDTFRNDSAGDLQVPPHALALGVMRMNANESTMHGIVYLGLDSLAAEGGSRVKHWGKHLTDWFGLGGARFSCARPDATHAPFVATNSIGMATDWVAVKNKYFAQILAPREPARDCVMSVERKHENPSTLVVDAVSATMEFDGFELAPGAEVTRVSDYYVGPKKQAILQTLGKYQHEIMQFGWWDWFRWICRMLLWTLNAIHAVIHNYGIAVILVTVAVRLLFWPITHKSTESMKKMQKIQPLVKQIRERHKDNPQKMNQEVMALYKEHRVNPMAGCLPMVVQIPVFIALFIVLRSAIELRFAPFLWIHDLSEPEGLLRGMLPMGLSLNILPLLMTATTVLQQRLTPTAGDPQQQKIMMIMPIMFLFLFYNMASALVLYWTVSQGLAIAQLVWQKRRGDTSPAGDKPGGKTVAKPTQPVVPYRPHSKKRRAKP